MAREIRVNVRLTKFLCLVLMGGLVALAAVLESNWLQEADPGDGSTFTLETIAAIIIGGMALYGGAPASTARSSARSSPACSAPASSCSASVPTDQSSSRA